MLEFKDYKNCLQSNEIILQQRFKSDVHNVFTDEINKISVSSNGDKILQDKNIFDKIFLIESHHH